MALKRKPFQGVLNIIRFNWHFYLLALVSFIVLLATRTFLPASLGGLVLVGVLTAIATIIVSLLVSWYVYDLSGLYRLDWLNDLDQRRVLTINAGFDETTSILRSKFPKAEITVCDFYNPLKHTEISIRRARLAYPPPDGALAVQTDRLPFPDDAFDASLAILSAHEIRDDAERAVFFREIKRVTKPGGRIMVTEHLRDWNNFLAYTIGFFHFHSRKTWTNTFRQAGLHVCQEVKTTPFITTFILEKHGNTP